MNHETVKLTFHSVGLSEHLWKVANNTNLKKIMQKVIAAKQSKSPYSGVLLK